MRRLLLIGTVGSGKTTLMQAMQNQEITYHKTQSVNAGESIVDTPGEYLDLGVYKFVLQLHSNSCDEIAIVHSATEPRLRIPPGFVSYFTKPVIGVITKIDIAPPEGVERARRFLELAGIKTILPISAVTGQGMDEFLTYVGDAPAAG